MGLSGNCYPVQRAGEWAGSEVVRSGKEPGLCSTSPEWGPVFVSVSLKELEREEQGGQKKYLMRNVGCSSGKLLFARSGQQVT